MTQVIKLKRRPMATPLRPHQLDICQDIVSIKLKAHAKLKLLIDKEADKSLTQPFLDLSHDLMKFLRSMQEHA